MPPADVAAGAAADAVDAIAQVCEFAVRDRLVRRSFTFRYVASSRDIVELALELRGERALAAGTCEMSRDGVVDRVLQTLNIVGRGRGLGRGAGGQAEREHAGDAQQNNSASRPQPSSCKSRAARLKFAPGRIMLG